MPNLPIADLHSHYPMHLPALDRGDPPDPSFFEHVVEELGDLSEKVLFCLVRRFVNDKHPFSGTAITLDRYRAGGVRIACSVLYSPFDELNADGFKQRKPTSQAFLSILKQMDAVEAELSGSGAEVARSNADLDRILAGSGTALVHCIEGGFQLGADPVEIAQNVPVLRQRGVLYVTLAHLLYRQVATNAPAFPFMPDCVYHLLHRQPSTGLTELGRSALREMHRHHILIDITHMSPRSLQDTFHLLDEVNPDRDVPVIASHIACRFGKLEYNLTDDVIRKVGQRNGVLGVIACEHYAANGLQRNPRSFADTLRVIKRHIDRIRDLTGGFDAVALGSDHDGFIRPTLPGLEDPSCLRVLADALESEYGEANARKICFENAQRVIRAALP